MLKTAEFAKMCHTTKDTLIFYDRIDVFKPAFVDSKKYRYYEVRQAVQFAFLSVPDKSIQDRIYIQCIYLQGNLQLLGIAVSRHVTTQYPGFVIFYNLCNFGQ